MKNLLKVLIATSILTTTFSVNAESSISKRKINGPECTSHIMNALGLKAEEAYQICSSHTEEVKICLIQNRKLNKQELLKKCQKK